MMRITLLLAVFLLFTGASRAVEVEGVDVPESVKVDGDTLQLNGVGVRTKFFFDIYIGALYLPAKVTTYPEVLEIPGPKQVSMIFLYDEVAREKLTAAWDEGFENNLSNTEVAALQERIEKFNDMFVTAHEGDVYIFTFHADGTTSIVLNGRDIGRIAGDDFQKALLLVWLGERPADRGLKEGMLGSS